jgi:gamma-glutamyl:cysteine ligase YbdK (ATP-grasp superfamily)
MSKTLSLFQAYGIEMEYMIVDQSSLNVAPICDQLIYSFTGHYVGEYEIDPIAWSNELALHVIELKTNKPHTTLKNLADLFQHEVVKINTRLKDFSSCLLPTAAHPWMNPHHESKLWPHDSSPVYEAYNRIFGCGGHGWLNLQSTHLNLPFANDEEFAKLHTAIRLLLPIIPALSASTPIIDGKSTGFLDTRLTYYGKNQAKIPKISGKIIPEAVFSAEEYQSKILHPMYQAIAPVDPEKVLQYEWLNSRGAIARFDRNAIEIRIIDVQECPLVDLAILAAVIGALKKICNEEWSSFTQQSLISEDDLSAIYRDVIEHGFATKVDAAYLALFGIQKKSLSVKELWAWILEQIHLDDSLADPRFPAIWENILSKGSLAQKILHQYQTQTPKQLKHIYQALSECLQYGEPYGG